MRDNGHVVLTSVFCVLIHESENEVKEERPQNFKKPKPKMFKTRHLQLAIVYRQKIYEEIDTDR